jgi:hypothetical protein
MPTPGVLGVVLCRACSTCGQHTLSWKQQWQQQALVPQARHQPMLLRLSAA